MIGRSSRRWQTGIMPNEISIDGELRRLLPGDSEWIWSADPTDTDDLFPEEAEATKRMAPVRLRSYRHGRSCAHRALRNFRSQAESIPMGSAREPVWPDGIVGSISHCEDIAVAVVAAADRYAGIGIDIELSGDLESELARLIATPDEMAGYQLQDLPNDGRLLFAVKESIYKCIWPGLRRFVDFQQVMVDLHHDTGIFTAHAVDSADSELTEALAPLQGGVQSSGDYVIAAAISEL